MATEQEQIILCNPASYTDDGTNDVFIYADPCLCDTGNCDCDCGLIPFEPSSYTHIAQQSPCEPTNVNFSFGPCPEHCIEFCCGADEEAGESGKKEVCFDHEPSDEEIEIARDENCPDSSVTENCIEFCVEWEYSFSWECNGSNMGICASDSISDSGEDCYDEVPEQSILDAKQLEIEQIIEAQEKLLKDNGCEPCDYEKDVRVRIRIKTKLKVVCCDGRVFNTVEEATAAGCKKIHIPTMFPYLKIAPSIPLDRILTSNVATTFNRLPAANILPPFIKPSFGETIIRPSVRCKICPDGTTLCWSIDCDEDEPTCGCDAKVFVIFEGCLQPNNPVNVQVISNSVNGSNIFNITATGVSPGGGVGAGMIMWNMFTVEEGSVVGITIMDTRISNNCCLKAIYVDDVLVPNSSRSASYLLSDNVPCQGLVIKVLFGPCSYECDCEIPCSPGRKLVKTGELCGHWVDDIEFCDCECNCECDPSNPPSTNCPVGDEWKFVGEPNCWVCVPIQQPKCCEPPLLLPGCDCFNVQPMMVNNIQIRFLGQPTSSILPPNVLQQGNPIYGKDGFGNTILIGQINIMGQIISINFDNNITIGSVNLNPGCLTICWEYDPTMKDFVGIIKNITFNKGG